MNTYNYSSLISEFIFPHEKIDNDENFVIFIKVNSKFNLKVELKKKMMITMIKIITMLAMIMVFLYGQ